MSAHNHSHSVPDGVYDIDYYHGRHKKLQLIYRLRRRTDEVESAIRRFNEGPLQTIVDVGTADALMLNNLKLRMGKLTLVGIDRSLPLLQAEKLDGIFKTQGDALSLPLKAGVADAVIATAVIEHVDDPAQLMKECRRILRPGGLVIITTPAPFMEKIASALGILKEAGHHMTLNMHQLKKLSEENGFTVLLTKHFMFSPIGFPAETKIEPVLVALGLKGIMANQLLVARRK